MYKMSDYVHMYVFQLLTLMLEKCTLLCKFVKHYSYLQTVKHRLIVCAPNIVYCDRPIILPYLNVNDNIQKYVLLSIIDMITIKQCKAI